MSARGRKSDIYDPVGDAMGKAVRRAFFTGIGR
jgi:hypothetical protein